MKRMTRTMADAAATELARIVYEKKLEDLEQEFKDFSENLMRKYVPKELFDCQEQFPNFFSKQKLFRIYNAAAEPAYWNSCLYLSTNTRCPIESTTYIAIAKEDFKEAERRNTQISNLKSNWFDYETKVSDALLALKTFSRIQENFPEALPYLNFSDSSALIPNLSELRNKLKK
jgi:hypothetical protein